MSNEASNDKSLWLVIDGERVPPIEVRPGTTLILGRGMGRVFPEGEPFKYVSGRHCEIRNDTGGCQIRDLGSTHGTVLNGVRLEHEEWRLLQTDDTLALGGESNEFGVVVGRIQIGGKAPQGASSSPPVTEVERADDPAQTAERMPYPSGPATPAQRPIGDASPPVRPPTEVAPEAGGLHNRRRSGMAAQGQGVAPTRLPDRGRTAGADKLSELVGPQKTTITEPPNMNGIDNPVKGGVPLFVPPLVLLAIFALVALLAKGSGGEQKHRLGWGEIRLPKQYKWLSKSNDSLFVRGKEANPSALVGFFVSDDGQDCRHWTYEGAGRDFVETRLKSYIADAGDGVLVRVRWLPSLGRNRIQVVHDYPRSLPYAPFELVTEADSGPRKVGEGRLFLLGRRALAMVAWSSSAPAAASPLTNFSWQLEVDEKEGYVDSLQRELAGFLAATETHIDRRDATLSHIDNPNDFEAARGQAKRYYEDREVAPGNAWRSYEEWLKMHRTHAAAGAGEWLPEGIELNAHSRESDWMALVEVAGHLHSRFVDLAAPAAIGKSMTRSEWQRLLTDVEALILDEEDARRQWLKRLALKAGMLKSRGGMLGR